VLRSFAQLLFLAVFEGEFVCFSLGVLRRFAQNRSTTVENDREILEAIFSVH
jgi:hypothetical protein